MPSTETTDSPRRASISVLIADDHDLLRAALCQLLADAGGFRVVAEASSGDRVLPLLQEHQPELLLLDQALPALTGLDILSHAAFPNSCAVVLLTGVRSEQLLAEAMGSRANAVVSKNDPPEEILTAIRQVLAGQRHISPEIAGLAAKAPDLTALTQRELQVLRLVGRGLRNKQVADLLGVSIKTVDSHRTNLMRKLAVRNLAALVDLAIRNGLVD